MSQPTPSAVRAVPSASVGPYVINLSASTTPMALSKPTAPELARFTFFVSRRREDGRERFRLHMGYFGTRDEAEQLLAVIRDLYPAAWVGEAPGKKLKAESAASPARTAPAVPAPAAAAPTAPAVSRPAPAAPAARAPAAPPPPMAPAARVAAPAVPPAAAPQPAAARPRVPPSNVREVIAQLVGEAAIAATPPPAKPVAPAARVASPPPPRPAQPPAAARPPVTARPPSTPPQNVVPPAAPAPRAPAAPAPKPAAATAPASPTIDELSDSQVLKVLETRRAEAAAAAAGANLRANGAGSASDIRLLSPDDTQTWRDIKSQLSRDAAVHFAVQLEWSVSPIDLGRIPGLAIFNAYTLYKIEGNRDGRKWYGLRLGFFSDAVAARQVALYVRSEFATVAVVPVSAKERGEATTVGAIDLPRPAPAPRVGGGLGSDVIELIDDAVEAAASRVAAEPEAEMTAVPTAADEEITLRRPTRPRGSPQTLEETLEILGASQLSIDDGKGVRLDLGNGHRKPDQRNSTFSKLLDRLAEKLRS